MNLVEFSTLNYTNETVLRRMSTTSLYPYPTSALREAVGEAV